MSTPKHPANTPSPPPKPAQPGKDDKGKDGKDGPVRTQMMGEHGDDDLGYDPKIIPTEPIGD